MMNKAYKFSIYPNQAHAILINKTIGYSRFVFQSFPIFMGSCAYKETGKGLIYGTCSAKLSAMKKELVWLKEVDVCTRFKFKKNNVQSYTTKQTNENIAVVGNKMKLSKLGLFRFARSREVEGRIVNATVRRNSSGR